MTDIIIAAMVCGTIYGMYRTTLEFIDSKNKHRLDLEIQRQRHEQAMLKESASAYNKLQRS